MPTIAGYKIRGKILESSTTIVFHALHPTSGHTIALKLLKGDHPQNELLHSFRREYALISSFDSSYICKTYGLEKYRNSLVMLLEDCYSTFDFLSEVIKDRPFNIERFLLIAVEITRALEILHSNKIIFRNLNPANILISKDGRKIKLVDFNFATPYDSHETGQRSTQLPESSLSYISPEQTGRIEQTVDYRTDFYSLGVTLFQLATGHLPFEGCSSGEIIHAHLAQPPPAPTQLNNTIPAVISTIILKLLEKNTSMRYQNCRSILADFQHCLQDLHEHDQLRHFELAEHDISNLLELPPQLYHRDKQLKALRTAFDRTVHGNVEIVCISGQSGVGKSSLVQEFKYSLAREKIYFLEGKFESTITTTPYATIYWTMRQLIRQVLSESNDSISRWKTSLNQVLNGECNILTAGIPELGRILGPQDPPAEYAPREKEHRLYRVFQKFFQACGQAQAGTPLILFLDDLHQADTASLKLLLHILSSAHLNHLLFIGAYRATADAPNSPPSHPLQLLQSLFTTNLNGQHQVLENLPGTAIEEILSRAMGRDKAHIKKLSATCYQKTNGNPFFLKKFLHVLNREGHLFYSPISRQWEWDQLSIEKSFLTQNAAQTVILGISALPPATRNLLKTASCLGNSFSLQLLSSLHGCDPTKSAFELHQAQEQGFLFTSDDENTLTATPNSCYHFAHTEIRYAVLALLSPHEQSAVHLRAGEQLLQSLSPEEYHNRLHEIAGHLNSGFQHISSRAGQLKVVRVNLDAAIQAKKNEDYQTAHTCITSALRALPKKSWQTDYLLNLEVHTVGCETAFLSGAYADVEKHFQAVCTMARDTYDTCQVYRIRIRALKAQSRPEQAVSTCLQILDRLGLQIPPQPGRLRNLFTLASTHIQLMRFSPSRLLALPEMTDRKAHAIVAFLHDAGTAAYSANPRLLPLLSSHAIRLSLKYGHSQESSVIGYLLHGFLLCALSGRFINQGCQSGRIALQLQEILQKNDYICQPAYGYSSFISHWKEHIRDTLPMLKMALRGYFGQGDLDSTANAAYSISFRHYLIGTNLNITSAEIEEHYKILRQLNQQLPLTRLKTLGQAVANLKGENADPTFLKGRHYDEEVCLPDYLATGDYTSYCITMIVKMIHAVLFNEYPQAIIHSKRASSYLGSLTSSVFIPVYHFYDSLARLACYDQLPAGEQLLSRLVVHRNQRRMQRWARHAPQNYMHKYSLVEAELARIRGNTEIAMELYDKAIHLAREHDYIQEEALAYELAARFYVNRLKPHIARPYLREARYCYYRWGATAKVRQLDSLEGTIPGDTHGDNSVTPWIGSLAGALIPGEGASRLDMLTVIKASRILSSEVVLDELLKKMMHIMLESGGAQRGFLIFKEDNEWVIRVRGSIYRGLIITLTNTPVISQNVASTAIINYVVHAAMDVVLNDARKEGVFTNDPYILEKKPRSVLCMPIIHLGEIFCILYLENNLATNAFPPDRQELLHLLGTQAAISLKNSSLFGELERTVGQLNSEVEKRRSTQQQLLHAEKLSALGRLSASIAHEFGNPLMGVKYLLDDFHKRENLSDSDRQLLFLGLEECDRMKKLIKDLQRLNKPSSGKTTRTDIHPLIENVLLFQKNHFSSNRIRLKKQYDKSLPDALVIVDQITQVLFNLTMNAVDAMTKEGGTLTVTTRRLDEKLIIEITDTGSGIRYENQERIFEPFYSTKKEEDGTGLGLSISYGIARHHGGNLRFISTPDESTTFILSLPMAPEAATEVTRDTTGEGEKN